MDFTPECKIVRAACLLNDFLNDNHRNVSQSSTLFGNNTGNSQSKVINASCMINEFLNENHRNMYKHFRHLRKETDFIDVPTNNFHFTNSRKETNLIDGTQQPVNDPLFISELNKINKNKPTSTEEKDYEINFPPLTAFSKFNKSYFKDKLFNSNKQEESESVYIDSV